MKKIGTFKIQTSFNILGRGIAAVCQHIEGMIKLGSVTSIEFDGTIIPARITGYDMPTIGEDGIFRWGIFLSFQDNRLTERIASEKLKTQIIEIFAE